MMRASDVDDVAAAVGSKPREEELGRRVLV